MQVKELKNEGLKREYKVTLPANDLQIKVDERLKETAKKVKIDGFRPGKVPLKLVKKQHGASIVAEVMEQEVSNATRKLMEERKIFPVLQPKIDVTSFDEGKDLEYTVALEVYPEIPELDFSNIKLEKLVAEITDKEINEGLERLRESQRKFEPLKKKRAAKKGDVVIIDFLGKVDGVAFDGGAAKDFRLELGSNQFIAGYEDQLVGTKIGEEKVVKVTFPENYGSKELAGKPAEFEVKVNDIQEAKLPDLNDDLATEVGYADLAALKEDVEKQISADYDSISRFKLKKELFDALDGICKFEAPESMTELELESLKKQTFEQADAPKEGSKEHKAKVKELEEISLRRVRLGLALSEIGRVNKIEVSQDELRKAVFEQARNYPGQEQKVIEFYQNNPQSLEQLKGPILEDNVVDFLFEKITVKDKKVPAKKLQDYAKES